MDDYGRDGTYAYDVESRPFAAQPDAVSSYDQEVRVRTTRRDSASIERRLDVTSFNLDPPDRSYEIQRFSTSAVELLEAGGATEDGEEGCRHTPPLTIFMLPHRVGQEWRDETTCGDHTTSITSRTIRRLQYRIEGRGVDAFELRQSVTYTARNGLVIRLNYVRVVSPAGLIFREDRTQVGSDGSQTRSLVSVP